MTRFIEIVSQIAIFILFVLVMGAALVSFLFGIFLIILMVLY